MAKKQVVLTKTLMKKISKLISEGHGKEEIATKIGISRQTFYRWEKKNQGLADLVKEAMAIRGERYEQEIIEIADDDSKDLLIDPETGRAYPNAAAVARAANRIKARQWTLKYNNPEKFGEKAQVDITSNGESVSGFMGLVIKPPVAEDDDVDQE